jgi:hypothetical protein
MGSPRRARPLGLDLVQNRARSTENGLRRRSAAAETSSGDHPAAGRAPANPSHPIRNQRVGLDRSWNGSAPRDLNPTDGVSAYRFAEVLNLGRPSQIQRGVLDPREDRVRSVGSKSNG